MDTRDDFVNTSTQNYNMPEDNFD